MKLKGQKIIIWCLIFSLLLPSFSVSAFASEVSGEIEPVATGQEDELFEDAVSQNDVTEKIEIKKDNSEDNINEKELSENSEQVTETLTELLEEDNVEHSKNKLENFFTNIISYTPAVLFLRHNRLSSPKNSASIVSR